MPEANLPSQPVEPIEEDSEEYWQFLEDLMLDRRDYDHSDSKY